MHAYLELLSTVLNNGKRHDDRTGVGTVSIFGTQTKYDIRDKFPLLTTKRLSFRWILEELLWFISGSTDVEDLRNRCKKPITIWDEWATAEKCAKHNHEPGQLGPIYGHQWRNFGASRRFNGYPGHINYVKTYDEVNHRYINAGYLDDGFDQFKQLLDDLKNNPRSRRLIISGWNPAEANKVELPPCHTLFQLKWDEDSNELHGQLYQRSADLFLGVPYNIASYSLLICLLAHVNDMKPGDFVHTIGDTHIYKTHFDQVQEQLSRAPKKLPQLTINNHLKNIFEARHIDFALDSYDPYESIVAEVAI